MKNYLGSGSVVGNIDMREKSSEIACAVVSNNGKCVFFSSAIDVSAAFVVTLTAAMTEPLPSVTGAAIERMPNDNRSSDNAHPRVRTSAMQHRFLCATASLVAQQVTATESSTQHQALLM